MNKKEIKKALKDCIPHMTRVDAEYGEGAKMTEFIGTFMSLDPCGRYHHMISPNGITSKCERYWDNLNSAAEELGGWIESGEGDPCDTFFSMPTEETEEEAEEEA